MSYFDDKQEILKVELTTYGRYLLSRGKFKPAYYAFFDDDILYDSEYTGLSEEQNDVQTRILEETPSLKPQTTYTSVENSAKLNTLVPREVKHLKELESQINADKNYSLSLPLANSSYNSDYAPAWALRMISGVISGNVSQYIDNASGSLEVVQPFLRIPQVRLKHNVYDIKRNVNDDSLETNYSLISTVVTGSDTYYYSMSEQPILIELQENNVDDAIKKFDFQLFVEEQELIPGTNQARTVLKQLNFKKGSVSIVDGILLDEPIEYSIEEDADLADYYFEITVDDEIDLPPQQISAMAGTGLYGSGSNTPPYGDKC